MSAIRTTNNHLMLEWAREEIGYTIDQAAEALGLSPEALRSAELGKHPLTLIQLRKAAEKFDVPFGFFYLSKPPYPKSFKPIPDFRIEPGFFGMNHHRLGLEIKKCRDRREVFIDLANKLDEKIKPFEVVAENKPLDIGVVIRQRLGISIRDIAKLNFDEIYNFWKYKIEQDGVLVYESQYIPEATGVIGVAIYYGVCPIILIKRGGDFNERKLFTLLHEYAHLLLGKSALNDASSLTIENTDSEETQIETLCNQIAGEILVPSNQINKDDYIRLGLVEKMEFLASKFKVTYSTAAVCLKRVNLIDYQQLTELLERRRQAAIQKRNDNKNTKPPEIPREVLNRLDMGRPMFNTVLEAYSTGLLDVYDASKILNLRVKKIDVLVART